MTSLKNIWDMTNKINDIATHPLQTTYWEDFRKAWGNEVLETPWGILTVHKIFTLPKLGGGGPLSFKIAIFEKGPAPSQEMLRGLKVIAKKNNIVFIKLEPNVGWEIPNSKFQIPNKSKLVKILKENGAKPGKRFFTPTTFWIDLKKSEEDLLKSFASKTRYNIRLAERKGVKVKEDNSEKAFKRYLELTRETTRRQAFFAHTEKYHTLMWKFLHESLIINHKSPIAHLFTATYKGKIITTWILFEWKNFLYYPYGASTDEHKEVMGSNLMMWEAIKFGRKKGLTTFDLWGREEGKGFTKFKEGYNPKVIEFLGTWDLVVNKPIYWIYKIAEQVRWKILKTSAIIGLSRHRF